MNSTLEARSKRMAKLMRYYNAHVKPVILQGLDWNKWEVHHLRGRVGTLLLDKRFMQPVERETHDWIQYNPKTARIGGFLCVKGLWGVAPNDAETQRLRELIAELTK